MLSAFGIPCAMSGASRMIGHRVLVDGIMGSGKSTFARALAARTGLPVIHLDVHYWKPGWVRPSDDEWRERQRALLADKAWIIDGNDNATLALRLERAETVVVLDSPWWSCSSRAFVRGFASPSARCPRAARTRSTDATSGAAWGGFGATADQNLSTHAPRSRGTGLTRQRTCSVRGEGVSRCRLALDSTSPPWPTSPMRADACRTQESTGGPAVHLC